MIPIYGAPMTPGVDAPMIPEASAPAIPGDTAPTSGWHLGTWLDIGITYVSSPQNRNGCLSVYDGVGGSARMILWRACCRKALRCLN